MKRLMILSLLLAFSLVVSAGAAFAAPGDPNDGVDFALLSTPGNGIYFGSYPLVSRQVFPYISPGNEHYDWRSRWSYSKGIKIPVLWRVMGMENANDEIVLMSEYIIDFYYFNSSDKTGTGYASSWDQSDIREWLNSKDHTDGFLRPRGYGKTFTDIENGRVVNSDVNTSKYVLNDDALSLNGTDPNSAKDYFYLLWGTYSFPWQPSLKATGINNVLWSANDVNLTQLVPDNAKAAAVKNSNEKVEYWLRSPSPFNSNKALLVEGYLPKNYIIYDGKQDPGFEPEVDRDLIIPSPGDVIDLSVDIHGEIYRRKNEGTGQWEGSPPHPYPGVRPVFKLDLKPESVILMSQVGGRGPGDMLANSDYEAGKNNYNNYKLTFLNENLSAGTVTVDGKEWTAVPPMNVPAWSDSWVSVSASGASDNTSLTYKLVDTSGKIVGYNQGEKANVQIYTIGLSVGDYSAYVWAQRDEPINSHEGSRPLYFNLKVSSNDAAGGSSSLTDLVSSEDGMIGEIGLDDFNRLIDAVAKTGKSLDLRVPADGAMKVSVRFPVGNMHLLESGLKISTPLAGNIMLNFEALKVLIEASASEDSIIQAVIARSDSADGEGLGSLDGSVNSAQAETLKKYGRTLREAYSLQILVDDTEITDFRGIHPGTSTNPSGLNIDLPCTPGEDSENEEINVYRVDDDGKVTKISSVSENGTVSFITNHLSIYALVSEQKTGGGGGGGSGSGSGGGGGGGCAAGFGAFALIAAAGGVYLRRKR
jgi:hypothetical protein